MRKSSFVGFVGKFQVLAVKKLRNSRYNNPKWEIAIEAIHPEHNTRYIATTATNASCGYYQWSYGIDRIYEMTGYFSKNGDVIINTAWEV